MAIVPVIPEKIRVHLGPPESNAQTVAVSFPDYIKNVASSEIYPTWPEAALRANIYAQISVALNRVFTEHYPSMGYDFDITNSTAYDQSFVYGRDVYENISRIVDEIFNDYIVRQGNIEPLFALYCDGVNVQCEGLSQWGSVELANEGFGAYDILAAYYGNDIDIVEDAPIEDVRPSTPGRPLRLGSVGSEVSFIQTRLNRISTNYPAIPKISPVDGAFGVETENAVREFQRIFGLDVDGVVGKATWYRIQFVYNSVKRLSELASEGLTFEEIPSQFPQTLSLGDTGIYVYDAQYYIRWISLFDPAVPSVEFDGVFGESTEAAVRAFQQEYDLPVTGVIDAATWDEAFAVYAGYIRTAGEELLGAGARPFPGEVLKFGSQGEYVTILQQYINTASTLYDSIPQIPVTGIFDEATRDAVYAAQALFGYPINGLVGPVLWDTLGIIYSSVSDENYIADGQWAGENIATEE